MEFEADAVRLRDVEELDELALDAADLLDRACPELNAVNFGAEADDGTADIVGSWPRSVGLFFIVSTHLPPFTFASSSHIDSIPDLNRW